MKRTVLFILYLAIVIVALRSPFAQYLLEDVRDTVSGWIELVATLGEREVLSGFQRDIAPLVKDMEPYQKEYMAEVMQSVAGIRHFKRRYCDQDDINPFVYGPTRGKLCQKIRRHKIFTIQ